MTAQQAGLARGIMILITTFWTYWSVGEMYHEGWWGPFYILLLYLIPGTAFLVLTLVAIKWPKIGGWLIIIFGAAVIFLFLDVSFVDGKISIEREPIGFIISLPLITLGFLFLVEARK